MSAAAPELVVNCRMLSLGWWPAEPARVTQLVPAELRPARDVPVILTQYVVDAAVQTSSLGPHSVTLLGVDLDDVAPGSSTSRHWLYGFVAGTDAGAFHRARGVEVEDGRTTIAFRGERVVGTTARGDRDLVRVTASVGHPTRFEAGRRSIIRRGPDGWLEEIQPWTATLSDPWSLVTIEFTDPDHPIWALRPPEEVHTTWGLYAPNASFCDTGAGTPVSPGATAGWSGRWRSPY